MAVKRPLVFVNGRTVELVNADVVQLTSLASFYFLNDGGSPAVSVYGANNSYWGAGEYNGYGSSKLNAWIKDVRASAASGSLSNNYLSQSNAVVTNGGATARVDLTLTERVGYDFDAIVEEAVGLRFVAAGGDRIRFMDRETAVNGYLQSTIVGSTLRMCRQKAGRWNVLYATGVWTDGVFTFDARGLIT